MRHTLPQKAVLFKSSAQAHEQLLFFRRWVKNPLKMGAVAPSSKFLAKAMAAATFQNKNDIIVELGGGTGSFTEALCAAGVLEKNLYVIEIDPELCQYLRARFPNVTIIQGDAQNLKKILPPEIHGKVESIISGIPFLSLPIKIRHNIIKSCFQVLKPKGQFVQFTYGLKSSLPTKKFDLNKERMEYVFLNFPPATVWRYWR